MFDEVGYEGHGIVQYLKCTNCGADIEYRIPLERSDHEEENQTDTTDND